ncbi:uncharacterized protein LOC127707569 [Mytilus californianus]|uniref:uncharacterized protein LOC127707569 n=1 Tax=Mytilus californianus TaxID=6549 RepID=UPI002247279C|nr:uncharacterized protein LOC127707569 [Mytilus californianus]
MAYSMSLGKGQAPVPCQFCENERKITNKCLNCNLLMCENCSVKLHAKVKGADDHTIVNIRSLGPQHSLEFKDFSRINCRKHPIQTACLFCTTCDQSVCPTCVLKVHKKHNIEEFQNVYELKVERLHCGQGKVEKDNTELERRFKNLDDFKTVENIRLSNIRENILDRATLIKSEIDEYVSKLITEVDEENTKFYITVHTEQSKIDDTKKKLNAHRQKAQEMKDTPDMTEFFAKITDVTQTMEKCLPPSCSITSGELMFLPRSEFKPNVVGVLQHENINRELEPKMKITKKYVTEERVVQFLTEGPDNSLWYSNNIGEQVLKRVKPGVKNLEILSRVNVKVYGLTFIPGYGLILSTDGETLKIIPEDSNDIIDSRFSVDPLEPKCIHLTKDNKLAIGAKSKGPMYPSSGQRVVILMDMEGNRLSTFEFNKKGKRLLTHPWGIASTTNGNVFILDRLSSNCDGRLVVLNRDDGNIIDIYYGREGEDFVPRGIMATESDTIIITDCNDPDVSLHIFNISGKLISHYNTRDIGIEQPFSITFSATGHFYIGGTTLRDSGEKAELFEIDLIET